MLFYYSFFIFFLYCLLYSEENKNEICGRRIIGFLHNEVRSSFNFTDKQAKMLTHLIFTGIKVRPPAKVDIFGNILDHIMKIANQNPHLKIILGLKITSEQEAQIFQDILRTNDSRRKLIYEIMDKLIIKNLNGIDIDWLRPNTIESSLYKSFLCELQKEIKENNLINVTISFSLSSRLFTNVESLMNCADFMNLFLIQHYPKANTPTKNQAILTTPLIPLFYNDYKNKSDPPLTIFKTLNGLACYSDNFHKFNLIFPPVGVVYEDVSNPLWDDDGLWRISKQLYSYIIWNEIRNEYNLDKFIFHEPTKTSYIFDEEKRRLISIEEPKSIQIKLKFAERYGIGGVGLDLFTDDDINNTLLNSISSFQHMCSQNSSFFKCGSNEKYDSYFYQSNPDEFILINFIKANIQYFILAFIIMATFSIIFFISLRRMIRIYKQQLDPPKLLKIEADDNFSLKLIQEIDKGKFGTVFLAEWGNEQLAVKTIDKQIEWSRHQIVRESAILENLDHENICAFYGLIELNNIHWGLFGRLGLINDFAQLGNLLSFLRARSLHTAAKKISPPPLMPSELLHIALMIAKALQYLFTKNILHRDIAARNCLVFGESDAKCSTSAARPNFTVKLSDFGMARNLNEYSMAYYMRQFTCMCFCFINKKSEKIELRPPLLMVQPLPIRWSSPETLKERKYSFASEIWSYGILLYEIYSYGKIPFGDADEKNLLQIIIKGGHPEIPANMLSKMKKILESCWNLDPMKRICINDLCTKIELLFAFDKYYNI